MSGLNIDELFDEPWFLGSAAAGAGSVPGLYQVAIGGHGYIAEPQACSQVTVPVRRESTDESVEPGEQTLNTEAAWKRSQDNWFLGAGQEFLDNRFAFVSVYTHSGEDPSVRTRFWRSGGVNPWKEGALSLLPEYAVGPGFSGDVHVRAVGSSLFVAGEPTNMLTAIDAAPGGAAGAGDWTAATGLTQTPTTAPDGSDALELVATTAGDLYSWFAPSFAITGGATYTLRGECWVASMTAAALNNRALLAEDSTGAVFELDALTMATAVGQWVPFSLTFTASAGATSLSTIRLYAPEGTVYWRRISLSAGTTRSWTPGGGGWTVMSWNGSTWGVINPPSGLAAWPAVAGMDTDGANLYLALGADGIATLGPGATTPTILRPTGPTPVVTPNGTTGTTTWTYYVVATDAAGFKSLVSAAGSTASGNATLSTTNYNEVTWTAVPGAVTYDLLRGDTAHAVATGLTATSFTDDGSHGVQTYTAPTATTDNLQADFILYANSFLLAAAGPLLASVGANGTATTVMAHFNDSFTWTCGASSPGGIYVAGNGGGQSEIYGIQLSTTTYALGAPYIAGQVTAGEQVFALVYYEGMVILATSLGVRAASVGGSGYLTTGPVISDLGAAKCLAATGPYVYFGVSGYEASDGIWTGPGTTSGLGRLFLSEFSAALLPAYATDVMVETANLAQSVDVLGEIPYFGVQGLGVCFPTGNVVEQGWLETGWVRYGTVEPKILISTDVRHDPLEGTVQIEIVPFGGTSFLTTASTEQGATTTPFAVSAGNAVGEAFMVIPILTRSATDATKGPVLRRWTGRALVTANRQDQIVAGLIWADQVLSPVGDGTSIPFDLIEEWLFLKGLEATGQVVTYQQGDLAWLVFIDQIEMKPQRWNDTKSMFEGIVEVKMLTVV